jgi:hypothetical protein
VQLMNAGSPSRGGASRNTIIHSRMAVSDTSLKRQPTRLDAVWIGIPTESQRRQESVVHVSDLSCRIETHTDVLSRCHSRVYPANEAHLHY